MVSGAIPYHSREDHGLAGSRWSSSPATAGAENGTGPINNDARLDMSCFPDRIGTTDADVGWGSPHRVAGDAGCGKHPRAHLPESTQAH
jgi:hypothetical protein